MRTEESKAANREYSREYHHRTNRRYVRHGLTMEAVQAIVDFQSGTCMLPSCDKSLDDFACVDHDHSCCPGTYSCGKCVRGLLCKKHNTAIGGFSDDPDLMREGIEHVEGPSIWERMGITPPQ